MKLYGLRIFVDDYDAAKEFYIETLGLPLTWEMEELGAFGAGLDNAEFIVEEASDAESDGYVGRFVGVSLQAGNIMARYEELTGRGVNFTQAPKQQVWGGVLAHFKDPAGNVLTLLGEAN
ncbi:VOC family protein [Polycladidibacter hongkongensis]|uniref:VOC family protein n=1 Tax=Polycladidibacter hongkongensis TaxID=1647556 RepID=UPI000834D118|nr:VOC family protein [Pseudovibrio hongkongensis]